MRETRLSALVTVVGAMCLFGVVPSAYAIPINWVCIGTCGTLGADGVVTAPPGGTSYDFVSTNDGVSLGAQDLNLGNETNGSILTSVAFAANAGDPLAFYFNYVTSDGAGFADYAWAELIDAGTGAQEALLFTARTTPGGNTAPGFGMPANSATLVPASTPIIPGGPVWSALGADSGGCFNLMGCGYTGWIQSTYAIPDAGTYRLKFGTVNWTDSLFDSGLAFAGTTVAGVDIQNPTPTPNAVPDSGSTLMLLGSAFLGLGALRRRFNNV
jgi:VPDSG-CTERM motif